VCACVCACNGVFVGGGVGYLELLGQFELL